MSRSLAFLAPACLVVLAAMLIPGVVWASEDAAETAPNTMVFCVELASGTGPAGCSTSAVDGGHCEFVVPGLDDGDMRRMLEELLAQNSQGCPSGFDLHEK